MNKARNPDGINNESGISRNRKSPSKRTIPKKQIRNKPENIVHVGIDLKQFCQVTVMNNKGKVTQNVNVKNTQETIRQAFCNILPSARVVI